MDAEPRKLLARLFAKGLIRDPTRDPVEMFLAAVGTPDTAEWSVITAQAVIDYVIDGRQDEQSRELCLFHFSPARFQKFADERTIKSAHAKTPRQR